MGAKIQFHFLTNLDSKSILNSAMKTMLERGWTYNVHIRGRYNYWLNGPIWEFGESDNHEEKVLSSSNDFQHVANICRKLSVFYSPLIVLGTNWFGNNISSNISIIELEDGWKEFGFSMDRYEAFDSLSPENKDKVISVLIELFSSLPGNIEPYHGIGGTELGGVVNTPNELVITSLNHGDLNFFSSEAAIKLDFKSVNDEFVKESLCDGSILVYRKHDLFKL